LWLTAIGFYFVEAFRINEAHPTSLRDNPTFRTIMRTVGLGAILVFSYYLGESSPLNEALMCPPQLPKVPGVAKSALNTYPSVQAMTDLWREYGHFNRSADASLLYKAPIAWDRRTTQESNDLPGQRVVVISADNRRLVPIKTMQPEQFEEQSSTFTAIYNTWWALRHGYDYRRIENNPPSDVYHKWGKVKAIYDMLYRYDYVVFFDEDVFVSQPEVGLQDMMEQWGFHEGASVMAALAPPGQPTRYQTADNFGFLVLRSNNLTKNLFRRLTYCVLGRTPEGETEHFDTMNCDKHRTDLHQEQTAFDLYLRPLLRKGEDFVISPCVESNGWWTQNVCKGLVITHAGTGNNEIVPHMKELMAMHHFQLYEKLLWSDYHYSMCTSWSMADERCQLD
jgi:hypothetical protein